MTAIKVIIVALQVFATNTLFAQPEFKGGQKALNTFITNNLIYPEYSKINCLQGTVTVSFRLNGQGQVSGSGIERGFETDLDIEALRIVRRTSGRWIVPTDHDTTIALLLPINFSLREFNCEEKSKEDIAAAVSAYKARGGLTQGILNFYDRRDSVKSDIRRLQEIEELKVRLGYDEKFLDNMLKQARQKLKQGDKQGACDDFNFIRKLGSNKAAKFLTDCR